MNQVITRRFLRDWRTFDGIEDIRFKVYGLDLRLMNKDCISRNNLRYLTTFICHVVRVQSSQRSTSLSWLYKGSPGHESRPVPLVFLSVFCSLSINLDILEKSWLLLVTPSPPIEGLLAPPSMLPAFRLRSQRQRPNSNTPSMRLTYLLPPLGLLLVKNTNSQLPSSVLCVTSGARLHSTRLIRSLPLSWQESIVRIPRARFSPPEM
jgi:hypothetical protein